MSIMNGHMLSMHHIFESDQTYYRIAGNFGRKIFWRIAENMSFGGIYFGG